MVPRGAARGAGALGVLVALAGLGGARAQPESVAGFLLRREEEPAVRAAAVDALNDIDVDSSPPQEEEVAGEESGLLAFLLQQAGDDLSAPEDPRLASFLLETDILAVANASARFAGFAGGAQAAQLAPGQPTLGELLGGALGPDPAAAPNLRVGAPDLVRPVGDLQFNCPDTVRRFRTCAAAGPLTTDLLFADRPAGAGRLGAQHARAGPRTHRPRRHAQVSPRPCAAGPAGRTNAAQDLLTRGPHLVPPSTTTAARGPPRSSPRRTGRGPAWPAGSKRAAPRPSRSSTWRSRTCCCTR